MKITLYPHIKPTSNASTVLFMRNIHPARNTSERNTLHDNRRSRFQARVHACVTIVTGASIAGPEHCREQFRRQTRTGKHRVKVYGARVSVLCRYAVHRVGLAFDRLRKSFPLFLYLFSLLLTHNTQKHKIHKMLAGSPRQMPSHYGSYLMHEPL